MLIRLKNKDTLHFDDKSTPKGIFSLGDLYFRKDRVKKPNIKLKIIKIKPNMGWCNDPNHKFYNKEILLKKKIGHEKLYRKDHKYDYFIIIKYNTKNIIPNKGSAIFIHLTNNYSPTAGCIALKKKDFLILLKLINKKTKIKIY